MFFDTPVPASDLRLFGQRVIELAGVPPGHLEFFPKQDMPSYDEAHGRFKASSIVRLPLGIHQKPEAAGARGWFDGFEKNIGKQSGFIAAQPFNPAAALLKFAPELRQLAAAKAALEILTRCPVTGEHFGSDKSAGMLLSSTATIATTYSAICSPMPLLLLAALG